MHTIERYGIRAHFNGDLSEDVEIVIDGAGVGDNLSWIIQATADLNFTVRLPALLLRDIYEHCEAERSRLPFMCRDDHPEVQFSFDEDGMRQCPVCQLKDSIERIAREAMNHARGEMGEL